MSKKKILIINAHPDKESLNFGLAAAYKKGAELSGAEVREIRISELQFNPNLAGGFREKTELEPDLADAQQQILWAEHLVWVHPVWWGGLPAIAKGFIDRVFLPGFAFRFKKGSPWPEKLLKGRTAHILTTLDQPAWYYRWLNDRPTVGQLKKMTLEFCGIKVKKVSYFGVVKTADASLRKKWTDRAEQFGRNLK